MTGISLSKAMSLDSLRRRLERVERDTGNPTALGCLPAIRIITQSDEDRDQQFAVLTAADECESCRLVIDRRIIDQTPSG